MSKELVVIEQKPVLPEKWDYEESIARIKPAIYKWKSLTIELATELWVAREILSTHYHRDDGTFVPSWATYCEEIDCEKRTVNRWLAHIFGEEEKISELETAEKVTGEIKPIIWLGDFRELVKQLDNESIDLIVTDPPYPKEFLLLWSDLAKEAKRLLKPSGFLISYSGQMYLPQVMNMLAEYLDYYWLGMLYHKGPTGQRFEVNMWNRAKPILFYQNPPRKPQSKWLEDVIESEKPDKAKHEWGQSINPVSKLIECFSFEGETVLDPFAGGGTTIEACILLKRQCYACETDEETYSHLEKRFL